MLMHHNEAKATVEQSKKVTSPECYTWPVYLHCWKTSVRSALKFLHCPCSAFVLDTIWQMPCLFLALVEYLAHQACSHCHEESRPNQHIFMRLGSLHALFQETTKSSMAVWPMVLSDSALNKAWCHTNRTECGGLPAQKSWQILIR